MGVMTLQSTCEKALARM
uniref:Uncharacterized protein n=1 Tax=Arundo donax TaxID=35708 RepID=A0A0A8YR61_ARUDO